MLNRRHRNKEALVYKTKRKAVAGFRILFRILPVIVMSVFFIAAAVYGQEAYPFNKGRSRFSLQAGSTRAFDRNYTSVGIGAGYYVHDGFEAGLDADA